MKKSDAGHKRRGEKSSRKKNGGNQRGGSALERGSQPATPGGESCFTSEELKEIETLKAERESLKEITLPKGKIKKARNGSAKPPTVYAEYVGSLRDADGRVRFAVEVLGSDELIDVLLNGPPDPKYGVAFDIPALMRESLRCAKDAESLPAARAHALMHFDLLEKLVQLTSDDWGYTIAAIAFISGGMCNRLREGETMQAAIAGDVAHRGRKKAGKMRERPEVREERLRQFQSLKMKKIDGEWEYTEVTAICREIARQELLAEDYLTEQGKRGRAETIEKQLRANSPEEFPLSRREQTSERSLRP